MLELTMTQQPPLPDREKVKQTVARMREVCRQFDRLNFALDELIAQVEAHQCIALSYKQRSAIPAGLVLRVLYKKNYLSHLPKVIKSKKIAYFPVKQ